MSHVSYERTSSGKNYRGTWSRKQEEYIADFELVSRRHLDDWHYRIFRYYFLLGADWKLCSRKMGMSRGKFFHAVYRIEEWLGKAFYELEPYALYPPRDYFVLRLPGVAEPCRPPAPRKPPKFRRRRAKPFADASRERLPA